MLILFGAKLMPNFGLLTPVLGICGFVIHARPDEMTLTTATPEKHNRKNGHCKWTAVHRWIQKICFYLFDACTVCELQNDKNQERTCKKEFTSMKYFLRLSIVGPNPQLLNKYCWANSRHRSLLSRRGITTWNESAVRASGWVV